MEQDFISQTALDQMIGSDRDQMMKAAIPYLPPEGQKVLAVYEKIKELRNTIAIFSGNNGKVSVCAAETAEPLEMVNDIRRFCYGQSRDTLDRVVNLMAVVEMMKVLNKPEGKE